MSRKPNTFNRSHQIYLSVREKSAYFAFAFIGCLMWSLSYLVFVFYKEIIICYLRRNEKFKGKAYYYKFIEYKPHFKNLFMFNGALIILWGVICFLLTEWRYYIITVGFYMFIIGYIFSWSLYYLKFSYKFYYFNEIKCIIEYIKTNILSTKKEEKIKKD